MVLESENWCRGRTELQDRKKRSAGTVGEGKGTELERGEGWDAMSGRMAEATQKGWEPKNGIFISGKKTKNGIDSVCCVKQRSSK